MEYSTNNFQIRTLVNKIQEELLGDLITGKTNIKVNNENLSRNGEISFPLNLLAWRDYIKNKTTFESCSNILEYYLHKKNCDTVGLTLQNIIKKATESLIITSRSWCIDIDRCLMHNDRICLFVNKKKTLEFAIKNAVRLGKDYGKKESTEKTVCLKINEDRDSDLTTGRLKLIKEASERVLELKGFKIVESQADFQYLLTTKSQGQLENGFSHCICGVVKNRDTNTKEIHLSWSEYVNAKIEELTSFSRLKCPDMSKESHLTNIAQAVVIFELLSIKPSRPVFIEIDHDPDQRISNSKGGSFVLYNAARISTILQKFKEGENLSDYPSLPEIDKVDFAQLCQEDEWELVYNFILRYPEIIEDSIRNEGTLQTSPQVICLFLSQLCQKFSIYYRRTRILTEGRDHLIPTMMARLYLLHALQIVINNSLAILNIVPVNHM
ncbi:DALR anticodon-binding domain-containing protein 3 [Venturia canescens]|uniref:DALR anticodon-binding domain-containing protein 3 n=1 Tax=Venturia canescens TaxID=32260 RepID=UPI001C9C7AEB|nr:DALR anticodon-binding domain-containing protein 3 [Venturia canescens]